MPPLTLRPVDGHGDAEAFPLPSFADQAGIALRGSSWGTASPGGAFPLRTDLPRQRQLLRHTLPLICQISFLPRSPQPSLLSTGPLPDGKRWKSLP